MMQSPSLESLKTYICNNDICSGCGICETLFGSDNIAIKENAKGLYRPQFMGSFSPTEEQLKQLIAVCPSLNMKTESGDGKQPFGRIIHATAGWATDENLRFKASSGGCVSAFLIYLLENHIVDGVIHVTRTEDVTHCQATVSRTREEVIQNCGSLYMPSKVLSELGLITNRDEKYAFVGKGCDIKALRRYNKITKDKLNIVYYIGIMCGGTPSYIGLKKILKEKSIDLSALSYLRFRGDGWPGRFKAISSDGKNVDLSYNEAWAKFLGPTSGVACKICFDGIAEESDITFGDAWYCNETNYPSFDETDGRNLILVRSEKGKKGIEEADRRGYIQIEENSIGTEDISKMQPSQFSRRYLAKYKIWGIRLLGYKYPLVDRKQLNLLSKNCKLSFVQKNRTIMGMIKRAKRGKN